MTCNLGTIPAGQSATVTIVVNIPSSATGAVSNTASVTSPDDEVAGNNSDTEMSTIGVMADLQIEKTPATNPVTAGTQVIYTLKVTNNGPGDATGVTVTDTFPASLSNPGCYGTLRDRSRRRHLYLDRRQPRGRRDGHLHGHV